MTKPTFAQIEHLFRLIDGGKITVENLQAFLELPSKLSEDSGYPITIDYNKSLDQMIAAGHYDWKNDDIVVANFPVTGTGLVEVKTCLVRLNREATTKEVEDHLKSLGLQSGKIEHLLALGAKYPDMQREFPIVALGSGWLRRVYRYVPYLRRDGRKRSLNLRWGDPGDRWNDDCRFLALSK